MIDDDSDVVFVYPEPDAAGQIRLAVRGVDHQGVDRFVSGAYLLEEVIDGLAVEHAAVVDGGAFHDDGCGRLELSADPLPSFVQIDGGESERCSVGVGRRRSGDVVGAGDDQREEEQRDDGEQRLG